MAMAGVSVNRPNNLFGSPDIQLSKLETQVWMRAASGLFSLNRRGSVDFVVN
jgi:hypothetical protein